MACEDNKCEKYGMHHYNGQPCIFCLDHLNKTIYEYDDGRTVIVLHNPGEHDPLHEMEK